jgi:hypothetical protein
VRGRVGRCRDYLQARHSNRVSGFFFVRQRPARAQPITQARRGRTQNRPAVESFVTSERPCARCPDVDESAGPGGIAGALEHRRDCVDTPCTLAFGRDMHLSCCDIRGLRGFCDGAARSVAPRFMPVSPTAKPARRRAADERGALNGNPSTNGAASAAAQNSASQASRLPACEPKNPSEGHVHQPFRTSADGIQVAPVQYRERITEHRGRRERNCVTGRAWVMWARIRLYRSSGFGWLRALYAAAHPRSRRFTLPTLAAR